MVTTISTSTGSYATAYGGERHLFAASDGTLCAIYGDGTNAVFRTASSSYTSWSAPSTIASCWQGSTPMLSAAMDPATNNIHVLMKVGTEAFQHFLLTYNDVAKTWTVGSGIALPTPTGGDWASPKIVLDPAYATNQTLWTVNYSSGGQSNFAYSQDNGATWTASLTGSPNAYPFAGIDYYGLTTTGKWLVWVHWTGSGFGYRRLDTTQAPIGAAANWSAETNVAVSGAGAATDIAMATDGNGQVILVAATTFATSTDNAAEAMLWYRYDATADTWTAGTTLGAAADRGPNLIPDGSGNLYLLWSQTDTNGGYALVCKKWSADNQTWDADATVLQAASGVTRQFVNGLATGNALYYEWTEGTTSPYNVQFDTLTLSSAVTDTSPINVLVNQPNRQNATAIQLLTQSAAPTVTAPLSLLTTIPPKQNNTSISILTSGVVPSDVWPKRDAFSANNFRDHFTSLDATKWTTVTTGSGTATVTDGYLDLTAPAGTAAFAYYNTKIDKTKSQIWWICGSCEQRAASAGSNLFSLYNSITPPLANTKTNLDPNRRLECGIGNQSGGLSLIAFYDPSSTAQFWNNATSSWGAYVNTRWSPAQLSDYYIWGLEIDGPNQRWRLHMYCQAFPTVGAWTADQGWREFGISDWVSWSGQLASDDLWLVLGHQNTDGSSTDEYRIEWVEYAEGPIIEAWAGAKGKLADGHQIRHYYSYDGVRFIPDDRTSWALSIGAASPDNKEAHNPCVIYDGADTDWMFYVGYDGTNHAVCLASAPHTTPQQGPWTKYGSNPLIVQGASGTDDDAQINFPAVVMDMSESDSNKRWKMLYNAKKASDNKWRTIYATAPAATGPWTKQGTVLDVGPSGSNDELWARSMSIVHYNNQWEVWYEGHSADSVDHLMRATGTDLGNLTKDGVSTYRDNESGQDVPLTVNLNTAPGRTITVTDTSKLTPDAMILLSQSTNQDTWSTTRIRKILSATQVETYHGITGFNNTYPARMIQLTGSRTWNARNIIRVGSEWWFYSVMWEPFSSSDEKANYASLFEQCFLMKHSADAPSGAAPQYQVFTDPVIPRGSWNDQESVENMSLASTPFVAPAVVTPTDAAPISVLTNQPNRQVAAPIQMKTSRTGQDAASLRLLTLRSQSKVAPLSAVTQRTSADSAPITLLSQRSVSDVAPLSIVTIRSAATAAPVSTLTMRTGQVQASISVQTRRTGMNLAGITAQTRRTGQNVSPLQIVVASAGNTDQAPISIITNGTFAKGAALRFTTQAIKQSVTPITVVTAQTRTNTAGLTALTFRTGKGVSALTFRTSGSVTQAAPITIQTAGTASGPVAPIVVVTTRTKISQTPISIFTQSAGTATPGLLKLSDAAMAKVVLSDI